MEFTKQVSPMGKRTFYLSDGGHSVARAILLETGEVEWICTFSQYQRKGYATALWNWMVEQGEEPKHSPCRLIEGDRWARKVGGELPPLHKIPCKKCGADFF